MLDLAGTVQASGALVYEQVPPDFQYNGGAYANRNPVWSPDGNAIAYYAIHIAGDCSGQPGQLTCVHGNTFTVSSIEGASGGQQWVLGQTTDEITIGNVDWAVVGETPTTCSGFIHDPLQPPWVRVNIRTIANGLVIGTLAQDIEVNLIDGYADEYNAWWWHVRNEVTELEGYVIGTSIDNVNNCPPIEVIPPPPPLRTPPGICYVDLVGTSADVRAGDGSTHAESTYIRTITAPAEGSAVYGISSDLSLYLINDPGILHQEWTLRSLFASNPPDARACQANVLGVFPRTSDPIRWSTIGFLVDNFHAPIDPALYNNEYHHFYLSDGYDHDDHSGLDIVYRPGSGATSTEFSAYAPYDGVVVDAGPSGITRRDILQKFFPGPEQPPNAYAGRSGVYYDADYEVRPEPEGEGWLVTYEFARTGFEDDDTNNNDSEEPHRGYYPFGLLRDEYENLLQAGFQNLCSGDYGCTQGPDRQMVIWHSADSDPHPDIQTVYHHIEVVSENYEVWRTQCSNGGQRRQTWDNATIAGNPSYDTFGVCRVVSGVTQIGTARWIGYSTGTHLHFEVWVDRNDNGEFDKTPNENENPMMIPAMIR
jgi:hypothetical protein